MYLSKRLKTGAGAETQFRTVTLGSLHGFDVEIEDLIVKVFIIIISVVDNCMLAIL